MDSAFVQATPQALYSGHIPLLQPRQRHRDLGGGLGPQTIEPSGVRAMTVVIEIFKNLDLLRW